MTITKKETVERTFEIQTPCYRKNGMWIVKINANDNYIMVNPEGNYFHHRIATVWEAGTEFFNGDQYADATEQEFFDAMEKVVDHIGSITREHFNIPA